MYKINYLGLWICLFKKIIKRSEQNQFTKKPTNHSRKLENLILNNDQILKK